jgi:polar amino acid transport system substrate-binding protein
MKKVLCLVVAVILVLSLVSCGAKDENKLVIGYTIYEPMNYMQDGKLTGFDTEFAEAVCAKLGVTPEFVEINWDNKFIDLKSKAIDCIWNGMTITNAVKEKTAVSAPYLENKQVVVCKADNASKFTDVASIATASKIAFEKGSAGDLVVTAAGAPDSKRVEAQAQRDALLEVYTGASEIAIVDLTLAKVMTGTGTYASLTFVDVGFELEEFGVSFRKSDAGLAKAFDLFIKICKADGTYDALSSKYFK